MVTIVNMCLEVNGEREDGRRNYVILFRIPGDSDNGIVNSQVTKNLIQVTMSLYLKHVTHSKQSSQETRCTLIKQSAVENIILKVLF